MFSNNNKTGFLINNKTGFFTNDKTGFSSNNKTSPPKQTPKPSDSWGVPSQDPRLFFIAFRAIKMN